MSWGPAAGALPGCRSLLDFPLFKIYGTQFPRLSRVHAGDLGVDVRCDLARSDPHPRRPGDPGRADPIPDMASALGHNVPRIFLRWCFAAGTALAGLAGVIGGNYQVTEARDGPLPWARSCSWLWSSGGLGSLTGCFHRLDPDGTDPDLWPWCFDVSLADLLAKFGFTVTSSTPFAEVLNVTLAAGSARLLPFLMLVLILVFRPRGLMGTRDT